MNHMRQIFLCTVLFCLLLSCSSAPERPAAVYTLRTRGQERLEEGNTCINRGEYKNAERNLNDARKAAVAADDPHLLVRTGLAQGNLLFARGQTADAAALWHTVYEEAGGYNIPLLTAVARLYVFRAALVLPETLQPPLSPAEIAQAAAAEAKQLADSPMDAAFAVKVQGLALFEAGDAEGAIQLLRTAAEQHGKLRYFEDAAYDLYLAASFCSRTGDLDSARAALHEAVAYDRRCENSFGLGADWQALGRIEEKAGNAEAAAAAYKRARDILAAGGFAAATPNTP